MHKTTIETETQKIEVREAHGHLEIHVSDLLDGLSGAIKPLNAMTIYYTPKGDRHDFAAYVNNEWVSVMKGEPRHGDGVSE